METIHPSKVPRFNKARNCPDRSGILGSSPRMATFPKKGTSPSAERQKYPSRETRNTSFFFLFFFFFVDNPCTYSGRRANSPPVILTKGRKDHSCNFPRNNRRGAESRDLVILQRRFVHRRECREFLRRKILKQVGLLNLTKLQIRSGQVSPEDTSNIDPRSTLFTFYLPSGQTESIFVRGIIFFSVFNNPRVRSRKFLVSIRTKEHESVDEDSQQQTTQRNVPLFLSDVTSATLGKYKLYCDFSSRYTDQGIKGAPYTGSD